MKPNRIFRMSKCLALAALATFMYGCLDKENLYTPDPAPEPLPPASDYPDFNLRGEVQLSVNYNTPGFKAFIELYDEYPLELKNASYVKKEGITPKYGVFTDSNSKFEGVIHIPTAVKKAYLYTEHWGLPMCVEMETTANGFVYDATKQSGKSLKASRASSRSLTGDKVPFEVLAPGDKKRLDNMYSISKWNESLELESGYAYSTPELNAKLDAVSKRAKAWLGPVRDRSELKPKNPDQINITTTQETEIDVTYLSTGGSLHCAFGYYYYPKNEPPTTYEHYYKMRKYAVIPNNQKLNFSEGNTFKLKYFGEDGQSEPSDKFPEGYSIGWFVTTTTNKWLFAIPGGTSGYRTEYESSDSRVICVSNETGPQLNFISLYDKETKTVIIGAEDSFGATLHGGGDNDLDDLMFFITTDPGIENETNRPEIPDENEPETGINSITGTLCFEDNWPEQGDYDMNDVAVEYTRAITVDASNTPIEIAETFKFVQKGDAANFNNFFAYQVDPKSSKNDIISLSVDGKEDEGAILWEENTKSFVINVSAKQAIGRLYKVSRKVSGVTLSDLTSPTNGGLYFNPYIIIGAYETANRKEVHLPKYKPTSAADATLIGTQNDAYYVNREGHYPFAIEIPKQGFHLADEKKPIDDASQYPLFGQWADNNNSHADWYTYPKGSTEK